MTEYLEQNDRPTCIRYLEHIINELGEAGPNFHDKLAELYLEETRRDWPKGSVGELVLDTIYRVRSSHKICTEDPDTESYKRLLDFLQDSTQYRPERLLGRSELEGKFKARANLCCITDGGWDRYAASPSFAFRAFRKSRSGTPDICESA